MTVRAKKQLGQHFLVDENILGVIGRLAELDERRRRARGRPRPRRPHDVPRRPRGAGLRGRARRVARPELTERLAGRPNVELRFGDALQLDLAETAPGATQARREPAVQHRDAACRREPRPPARDRAVVRDGAARGRRPLLREAVDEGVRRRLGAGPARRRAHGLPSRVAERVPAAAERRLRAGRVSANGLAAQLPSRQARRRGSFAHRRKQLANSLELAGIATSAEEACALPSTCARKRCRPPSSCSSPRPLRMKRAAAAAKINLALVVGPRRDDGLHELVTVYQRVALADRLAVARSPEVRVAGFAGDTLVRGALECSPTATASFCRARSRSVSRSLPVSAAAAPTRQPRLRLANAVARRSRRRGASACSRVRARRRRSVLPGGRPAARHGRRHRARAARSAAGLLGPPRRADRQPEARDGRCATPPSTRAEAQRDTTSGALHWLPRSNACAGRATSRRLPPNDLASSPLAGELMATWRVPRRRHGRRTGRLRALLARRTSASRAEANVPQEGAHGSRHQRGTVDYMAYSPAHLIDADSTRIGRWLRARRLRLALWVAVIEGVHRRAHDRPLEVDRPGHRGRSCLPSTSSAGRNMQLGRRAAAVVDRRSFAGARDPRRRSLRSSSGLVALGAVALFASSRSSTSSRTQRNLAGSGR